MKSDSSYLQGPTLLATNQTEFNRDALPTRRGRPQRTRDMSDLLIRMYLWEIGMQLR